MDSFSVTINLLLEPWNWFQRSSFALCCLSSVVKSSDILPLFAHLVASKITGVMGHGPEDMSDSDDDHFSDEDDESREDEMPEVCFFSSPPLRSHWIIWEFGEQSQQHNKCIAADLNRIRFAREAIISCS